jgi:hypothetical protein
VVVVVVGAVVVVVVEVVTAVGSVLVGGSEVVVVVSGPVVEVVSIAPVVDEAVGVVKVESSPQAATRIPRTNTSSARRFIPDLLNRAASLATGTRAEGMATRGRLGPERSPPGVGDLRQKSAQARVWGP